MVAPKPSETATPAVGSSSQAGKIWFVSEQNQALITKLLLERISLAGICRVCDVSQAWLPKYLKELYGQLPDDLNADHRLPELEDYLAERMDEEIKRLTRLKKHDCLSEIPYCRRRS